MAKGLEKVDILHDPVELTRYYLYHYVGTQTWKLYLFSIYWNTWRTSWLSCYCALQFVLLYHDLVYLDFSMSSYIPIQELHHIWLLSRYVKYVVWRESALMSVENVAGSSGILLIFFTISWTHFTKWFGLLIIKNFRCWIPFERIEIWM